MVDLRGGAVINDGPAEVSDVHRHSVPLDAPHMGRPTCRVVRIQGGCSEAIRIDKLIASFLFTPAACHYDDRHPIQETDLPLELREEDAIAKSKRHATIHVAITRVAAHPSKTLADLSCIRIILRPNMAGLILVGHAIPVVLAPFSVFKIGLLEVPDQRIQVWLETRVQLIKHDVALGFWDVMQEPALVHQNIIGDLLLECIVVTCKIRPWRTIRLRKVPLVVRQFNLGLGQCFLCMAACPLGRHLRSSA